ncbi:MAG: flagellar export protein FliJ [Deltaproteobacteria bacterium]|nr:flagellar export protein FliJ [Deltaproteobacteria bacterium]
MFRYRLQSVLKIRERITRLKLKSFSEVELRTQIMKEQVVTNRRSLAAAGRNLDMARQQGINVFQLQQHDMFSRRIKDENGRLGEQIRELTQELEARRKDLVEARRRQRTLEILKEKAEERYREEQQRQERIELDEISCNYHVFKGR